MSINRNKQKQNRFNRTLAERLFGYQYAVEMRLPEGQRSLAWVWRLPRVVAALNCQKTRLIDQKPAAANKQRSVFSEPTTAPYERPVGVVEKTLPGGVHFRYLFQPGELEGGVQRATDPIWSLDTFTIERAMRKPNQPIMYWLNGGPKRSFVREELMAVPPDTKLLPVKPT